MTFTQINEKLIGLVKNERQLTHEILNHILLFQKCDGYLKLGYSSMHQYLTRGLGYSDDQAYRRLKAARLINELPEVVNPFQLAKLNLSQMAEMQKAFETSERETHSPVKKEIKTALIVNLVKANNFQTKNILNTELGLKPKIDEKINPQSDQTVRLEISLTKEQFEKLQTIKNLISHHIPDLNTAKTLEAVFDFFISKKQHSSIRIVREVKTRKTENPMNQVKTQEKAKMNVQASVQVKPIKMMTPSFMDGMKQSYINQPENEDSSKINNKINIKLNSKLNSKLNIEVENSVQDRIENNNFRKKINLKRSRYIPIQVKNKVFEKSQGCCEYVGPSGVRCNSRYQIQIDHHHAFSLGGNNSNQNLRNLCARHNRLAASEQGVGFETTSHYNT